MKLWLSFAIGFPIAVVLGHHFIIVYPFARLADLCSNARNYHATSGVINAIDHPFCFLVNVFTHAMHDSFGYELSWILLFFFGSVLTIMLVEGSRSGTNWIISCVSLWGFIANMIGISITLPLMWVPAFYYCYGDNITSAQYSISASRLYATLIAILMCYLLPTIFMLFGTIPYSPMESNVIALWQLAPLLLSPAHYIATWIFDKVKITDDKRKAVWRLYMPIGAFNAVIFYAACVRLKSKGLLNMATLVGIATLYKDEMDLTSLTLEQLGKLGATHVFLLDTVVTFGACCVWAALENGYKGLVVLLLSSILAGPGTGLCIYAVYREENMMTKNSNNYKKEQ
ncbi:hypothetical protein O0I10_002828 [Lichtheimia ornata]|uniref:Uncharacterized protein n=1 Tax=Lichtheimia ornata TaxID=688661 RepID=A0AAD7VB12_9FUNG|nr:uncharacterized protein O0I10_002828 [Lichtheimia ornata]KAJ8661560.1 hypothetical protein O0I10_002828 [Lichtheimia ornata]